MVINIFTDGASRGNPGDAGIGVAIFEKSNLKVKICDYLGKKTNNYAEYLAVICALKYLKDNDIKIANIYSDSQFLVKQINGEYKVKSENIKPLYEKVKFYLKDMTIKFTWIRREDNTVADSLANLGIDLKLKKIKIEEVENLDFSKKLFNTNCDGLVNSCPPNKSNLSSIKNLNKTINKNISKLKLIIDRAFFGKINCLKIQMNDSNEVYFHMGIKNSNIWVWEKVKINDVEIGEILHLLSIEIGKCSFYHSFGNKKTQIWCNKTKLIFSIKIGTVSKNLSVGEFEILKIILIEIIKIKSFIY